MMPLRVLLSLCVVVFSADRLIAQGEYLQANTSGFGFGGSASLADSGGGFGLWSGYSMNALVDIGFGVERFTADESDIDGLDLHIMAFGPSLSFYPMRQTEYVPLTIRLGGAFAKARFSGDELDRALDFWEMKLKGRVWNLGGEVIRSIPLGDGNYFAPSFGITHSNFTTKLEERSGASVSNDVSSTSFSATLGFSLRMEQAGFIVLRPAASFGDDETVFTFSVGFVLASEPPSPLRATYVPPVPVSRSSTSANQWHRPEPEAQPSPHPESMASAATRSGEVIPWATQAIMKGDTAALSTASVALLSQHQLKTLSSVFKVPAASIIGFRWGESTSPANHPHHQTTFFVIEHGDDSYRARETLRVDRNGEVVERKKE
jgi:hypothetical protein